MQKLIAWVKWLKCFIIIKPRKHTYPSVVHFSAPLYVETPVGQMSQWLSLRRLFASAAGLLVGIKPSEGLSLFRAERNSIDRLSAFTFKIKCHIISATCGSSSQGLSEQDLCSP